MHSQLPEAAGQTTASRWVVVTSLACALLLIACHRVSGKVAATPRLAVIAVLNQYAEAHCQSFSVCTSSAIADPAVGSMPRTAGQRSGDALARCTLTDFTKRLLTIDTRGCPEDFQFAFGAHAEACARKLAQVNLYPGKVDLTSLIRIGEFAVAAPGETGPAGEIASSNAPVKATLDVAEDQVRETRFALERAALKYGVKLHPQNQPVSR